jgi:hypothetical protein
MVVVRNTLRLALSLHGGVLTVFTVWTWGSELEREDLKSLFR